MDGETVRTFKWVQGSAESIDYAATEIGEETDINIQAFGVKSNDISSKISISSISAKKGGKFGLPLQ